MFNRSEKTIGLAREDTSDKIVDALKVLDEAAVEKGHEIRSAVEKGFKHLHRTFSELEAGSWKAMDFVEKKGKDLRDVVISQSAKTVASINQQFKTRPWVFIGGFTLVGIGIGYLLGQKMKGAR